MKISEMNEQAKTSSAKQKTVASTYDELKNCTSDELMSRLQQQIAAQKQNGTFDYEMLRQSIEKIKIYLPTQTYENLLRIIESFK